jgi:transposase-like protein
VAVLSVSDAELKRLEVLRDVDRGGLPVRAAAQLLGRSERQVWRLLKAFGHRLQSAESGHSHDID